MSNTQVFLAQKYDGLPLVVDELVRVLSLKLVDELDEVMVTVLAVVLGTDVCQLILALDVVDADLAPIHQFLLENIPQRDVLRARTVGTTVADDVQRRRVIDIQWHAAESLIEAQLQHRAGAEYRLLLHCQSRHPSSASVVDCAVSPCSPTLMMIGAWASVTMYDDVNLSWPL